MQDATVNFSRAITGAGRVRTDRLLVDWGNDGAGFDQILDTFDRFVSISDEFARVTASGFGTATSGQVWTIVSGVAANFSTDGGEANINVSTVTTPRLIVLPVNVLDFDLTWSKIVIGGGVVPTGAPITVKAIFRYVDASNFYCAEMQYNTSDLVTLRLRKNVAGTFTELDTFATGLSGSGTAFAMRAQMYGDTMRAKVWNRSLSEPATWMVDATDDEFTDAGSVALSLTLETGNSNALPVLYAFDTFTVTEGWNHTETGERWLTTGSLDDAGSVAISSGGDGTHRIAVEASHRTSYLDREFGEGDLYVNWSCPAPSGAAIEPANLLAHVADSDTYLMMRITVAVGGAMTLAVMEVSDGVQVTYGSTTVALVHNAGTTYTLHAQVFGTEVRMHLFEASTTEAFDTWDLITSYTGELRSGSMGVRSGVASGNLNTKPVVVTYSLFRIDNGLLDDMSPQIGPWLVEHHLDDGLPDEVSFVAGTAVPTLRAEVIRPGWVPGRGRMTNREFFSPFNTNSPIYGFPRDVPPTTLEAGVVTEDGREYLHVFTGQAQDFVMRSGEVTLSAISATRLALAKLVHLPAVYGLYEGANATWAISYAMAACGVYASPPPQDGCRWWAPMHGSIRSFIPATNTEQLNYALYGPKPVIGGSTTGGQHIIDMEWIEGPFVNAPDLANTADRAASIQVLASGTGVALGVGEDIYSQAGNLAKIEMWVRCDDALTSSSLVRLIVLMTNGTSIDLGISGTNRRPFLQLFDGTTTHAFFHSTAIPTTGEWMFVGWAWRVGDTSKRWINLDGVTETSATAFSTAGLGATDSFATDDPNFAARIPVAEVQLTSGETANPDNFPWLLDIDFTPGAYIEPSSVNLHSIAEREPREVWELISSYALAELASLRIDELDIVRYLGFTFWGRAEQQVVVDVLDSSRNLASPDVNIDPTKIRNSVAVTYSESHNQNSFASAAGITDAYLIGPGLTRLTLATTYPVAELRGFSFDYIAAIDTDNPTDTHFVTLNSAEDGTGTYGTAANVTVEVLEWDPGSVTILFTNHDGADWYTANDKGWSSINLAGKLLLQQSASIVESDVDSIAVRGERGLTLNLPALQRSYDARRTAQRVVSSLASPVPLISQTSVRGDPRRQPGDLVTVVDRETAINNRFRLQSVYHDDNGELYTQKVTMRRALQGGQWGVDFYWGQSIWTED